MKSVGSNLKIKYKISIYGNLSITTKYISSILIMLQIIKIMDRKEYLNKIAELNHQIRMLKDDYITSNTDIPAGSYVIITCEGKETRAYLKEYKIVDGYIKPVFNACLASGRGCAAYILPEFPGNISMRLA